jgi:ribose 1,5-bisphosphokinase PhnN
VLLLRADGSVLVGFGALPEASKDRFASIFSANDSCYAVPKLRITCCVLAGNVAVINKATNIPSSYSRTRSGRSLVNTLCGVKILRTEAVHY